MSVPEEAKIESFCCIPIMRFAGDYAFLSNFSRAAVEYESVTYPSLEHAYQAAKFVSPTYRERIRAATKEKTGEPDPGLAKRLGHGPGMRTDWDVVKIDIMWELLCTKFEAGSELADRLLSTGYAHLIEGNKWHDNFWGVCYCPRCARANPPLGQGRNVLGKLLMGRRQQLRDVNWASH